MGKELHFDRLNEAEAMLSGSAEAIKRGMLPLINYHAFETLNDIGKYLHQKDQNDELLRSALFVAEALRFEEYSYFKYKVAKEFSPHPHITGHMKRWKDVPTLVELSLRFNRQISQDTSFVNDAVQEGEMELSVASIVGQGFSLMLSRYQRGEHQTVDQRSFSLQELRVDHDAFIDSAWHMVRKHGSSSDKTLPVLQ